MCYAPCKKCCFKPCKQTQTKNKLRESIRFSHKSHNLFYVVIEGEKQMQSSNKKKQGMNYKECKIKFLKITQNRNMCISLLQLKMKIHDH